MGRASQECASAAGSMSKAWPRGSRRSSSGRPSSRRRWTAPTIIIVVTGSHFHADVAHGLAGVLRDGQSILLIQGGTGGSLLVRRELRAAGCRAAVDVSEMDNYPDSLAWPEPTRRDAEPIPG